MLRINDLELRYPNNPGFSLGPLTISVLPGEILTVIGQSGEGKTSLLKVLSGHLDPTEGNVFWKNEPILGPKDLLVPGHAHIQRVDQEFDLMPYSSVRDNLRKFIRHLEDDQQDELMEDVLGLLGFKDILKRFPKDLSGGEKQRVALGRALLAQPELLILDEPFSHLDQMNKHRILSQLKTFAKRHDITMVVVLHDIRDALLISDNLCVLENGKVVFQGNSFALFQSPPSLYVANLLHLNYVLNDNDFLAFTKPETVKRRFSEGNLVWPWEFDELKLADKGKMIDEIAMLGAIQRTWQVGQEVWVSQQGITPFGG